MQEKKKFIISITGLLLVTAAFWIVWIVKAYDWVNYRETGVRIMESLLIALAAAMIVSGYLVFRIARPSYLLAGRKKLMLIAMCSILGVMLINFGMLYKFEDFGYTITAVSDISHKESKGGKFYFQIKDSEDNRMKKFECDQKTYDKLEIDGTLYSIQYRKLNFGSGKAVLGYIDVNRPIEENE